MFTRWLTILLVKAFTRGLAHIPLVKAFTRWLTILLVKPCRLVVFTRGLAYIPLVNKFYGCVYKGLSTHPPCKHLQNHFYKGLSMNPLVNKPLVNKFTRGLMLNPLQMWFWRINTLVNTVYKLCYVNFTGIPSKIITNLRKSLKATCVVVFSVFVCVPGGLGRHFGSQKWVKFVKYNGCFVIWPTCVWIGKYNTKLNVGPLGVELKIHKQVIQILTRF